MALTANFRKVISSGAISASMQDPKTSIAKDLERQVFEASSGDPDEYARLLMQTMFALQHESFREEHKGAEFQEIMRFRDVDKSVDRVKKLEMQNEEDRKFEGYLTCSCGSKDIQWDNRQTRSTDEGYTLFCICRKCGNEWRKSA